MSEHYFPETMTLHCQAEDRSSSTLAACQRLRQVCAVIHPHWCSIEAKEAPLSLCERHCVGPARWYGAIANLGALETGLCEGNWIRPEVSFSGFFFLAPSTGGNPKLSGESLKKISTSTDTAKATHPGANMPYLHTQPTPCCWPCLITCCNLYLQPGQKVQEHHTLQFWADWQLHVHVHLIHERDSAWRCSQSPNRFPGICIAWHLHVQVHYTCV